MRRPVLAALLALGLAGCNFQHVADPTVSAKDAEWMRLTPQAELDPNFARYLVTDPTGEAPGTIVVDTFSRHLYLVLPERKAIRYGVAVGGEWTPDINSVNSYLRRMTFRVGFNYSQMPVAHRGRQLADRSLSFGVSLPITPQDRSGVSYINTTFLVGRRGDGTLLQENYFRVIFGFSINAFDWFRRYRID